MYRYITIEGIPAAGKSTFLKALTNYQKNKDQSLFSCIQEPEQKLCCFKGHNPIELLYTNPYKEASMVQMYIAKVIRQHFMSEMNKSISTGATIVCERSPAAGLIFLQAMASTGYITKFAYDLIHDEYSNTCSQIGQPEKIFYLDTPLETCMQRMKIRDRTGEIYCDPRYLQTLEKYYTEYLHTFRQLNGPKSLYTAHSTCIPDLLSEFFKFVSHGRNREC